MNIRFLNTRFLAIVLSLGFSTSTAMAGEWTRQVEPRSGIGADLPAAFLPDTPAQPFALQAAHFRSGDGRSTLGLWGEPAGGMDLAAWVSARIAAEQAQGWSITNRTVTPDWAIWSGMRSGMIVYGKSISTCNGERIANVRFVYPALDSPRLQAVAERVGASLGQDRTCN